MVYIKLEQLKNYIAYVEQESQKAGVTVESIGMYYAKYPDQGELPSGKTLETNRYGSENLILSPMAYFPEVDYEVSYVLQTNAQGIKEAIPVRAAINHLKNQKTANDSLYEVGEELQSLAANDLPWRPPPPADNLDY